MYDKQLYKPNTILDNPTPSEVGNGNFWNDFAQSIPENTINVLKRIGSTGLDAVNLIGETVDKVYGLPGKLTVMGLSKVAPDLVSPQEANNLPSGFSGQVGGVTEATTGSKLAGAVTGLVAGLAEPLGGNTSKLGNAVSAISSFDKAEDVSKVLSKLNIEEKYIPTLSKALSTETDKAVIESKLLPYLPTDIKNIAPITTKFWNTTPELKTIAEDTSKIIKNEYGVKLTTQEVLDMAAQHRVVAESKDAQEQLKVLAEAVNARKRDLEILSQEKDIAGVTPRFIEAIKNELNLSSEAGRALAFRKINVSPEDVTTDVYKSEIIKKLLKMGVSEENIIKSSEGVDFNDAKQTIKFYREFVKPKLGELLDEYRYINLLSSPKTHIVNAFSNMLQVGFLSPVTKGLTAGVDFISSALTKAERTHYFSEIPAYYRGVISSIGDASGEALSRLSGKMPSTNLDISHIPSDNSLLNKMGIITRAMDASDVFFRSLVKNGEISSLSERAIKSGKELDPSMADKIEKIASERSNYYVFRSKLDTTNKTGQGNLLSWVDKTTGVIQKGRNVWPISWYIPFVQTPMNILKQGIEYSPLGFLTLIGNTQKKEQTAKALLGSIVFATAADLAMKDKITWGVPTDNSLKDKFYASGLQPYSIKIGDQWYSYSKLGPLSYPFAMAAAIKQAYLDDPKSVNKTSSEKIMASIGDIGKFFSDQSYMQGIGDIVNSIQEGGKTLPASIGGITAQLIPMASLQRWVNGFVDDTFRKVSNESFSKTFKETLEKSIIGMSKNLEPYTTPTGMESKKPNPVLNAFSPVQVTNENPEMMKLYNDQLLAKRIQESKKPENIEMDKKVEELFNNLKDKKSGEILNELRSIYKKNPDEKTKIMVKKVVTKIRNNKNLTPTEKIISNLQVSNGERAEFLKSKIEEIPESNRKKYLVELSSKKLVNKDVLRQLKDLGITIK